MIDQQVNDVALELLMISVRVCGRTLPEFWCAKETNEGIGFTEQKKILDVVRGWLPEDC